MRRLSCVLFLGGMPLACGDDGAAPVEPSSTSSGESGTSMSMPTTTDVADTSTSGATTSGASSESTGEQMFDLPTVECGNGYVEVGEDCDDGNDDPLDACPNDCIFPCSVEWELVRSGPTQESDVYGLAVAADGAGGSYAIGYQREITVDEKGMQAIGEVSTLVVALDDTGMERWSTTLAAEALAVRPGAVAVDADGVPHVSVTREVMGGSTDVQVLRLAPEDGEVIWTHDIVAPVMDGDDEANALAVAPDGTILVSATIAVADDDDDAWLRKLDADGAEVWTTSFDGPSEGQYSTDNAGPVAVGSDGRVALLAQAYVDFSASPATLLVFDEDGGAPLFTWTPEDDGGSQELTPIGVGFDADGNVYANYQRVTSQVRFWVVKLDTDGEEVWLYDEAQFFEGADASVSAFGIGPTGPVLVGTHVVGDGGDAWAEVWFSQADLDAAPLCTFSAQGSGGGGVLPPSLLANGGAVAEMGKVLAVGQWIDEEEAVWVARARAWGE
jgi:cysteine-rich repeat protein